MTAHKYAFLIGNGLAIAYNPALAVPALRDDLLLEFSGLSGGRAEEALAGFAARLSESGTASFENLLGPLEHSAAALPYLDGVVAIGEGGDEEIRRALATTASFLKDLHRVGLSVVLKLIAERAKGQKDALDRVVIATCRAILDLNTSSPRTIATLNYDGLLHAGFLKWEEQVADLGAGYLPLAVSLGDRELEAHELRSTDDMQNAPIHLLNLHGSLGWLMDPETRVSMKFKIDDLRDVSYWDLLAAGNSRLWPLVVLTDQKTRRVATPPFALAYATFRERLARADRWLVGGYSFSDEAVNVVLNEAYEKRVAWRRRNPALTLPRILVIDKTSDQDAIQAAAANTVGCPVDDVRVAADGFPTAVGGDDWNEWAT